MSKPKPTLVLSKRLHSGVKAEPQYLSGLDIFHAHAGIPLVLCFKQGFDLAHVEKALVATLASYPCVTGRYRKDKQGHVYLDSNDAGLDWNVYRCKGPLPYGPHHPVGSDIHRFYKLYMPWNVVDHDRALMQINIHQFEDGGILFCAYAPHSAQDGSSWWGMIQDWSRTCLGQELKGQSFDRQVLIDAGKVEADPAAYDLMAAPSLGQWAWTMARLGWQAVFGMKSESFRIPAKVVGQWREQAKAELPNSAGVSVAELATTYLMKAMSPAMPSGVARSVGLVLDLRYKRRLRLPRDLYGNALCYAEARYSAEELASDRNLSPEEGRVAPDLQAHAGNAQRGPDPEQLHPVPDVRHRLRHGHPQLVRHHPHDHPHGDAGAHAREGRRGGHAPDGQTGRAGGLESAVGQGRHPLARRLKRAGQGQPSSMAAAPGLAGASSQLAFGTTATRRPPRFRSL